MNRLVVVRRSLALIEVLGGGAGLLVIVPLIFSSGGGTSLGLCLVTLYALSIIAGIQLWRARPSGLMLSLACQALQLVWFDLGSLAYLYVAGASLFVGSRPGGAAWSIGSRFNLAVRSGTAASSSQVGVNLFALVMLSVLIAVGRKGTVPALARPNLPAAPGISPA